MLSRQYIYTNMNHRNSDTEMPQLEREPLSACMRKVDVLYLEIFQSNDEILQRCPVWTCFQTKCFPFYNSVTYAEMNSLTKVKAVFNLSHHQK